MLDIKFIRDNAQLVKGAVRKKHIDFNVDELLDVDDRRRALTGQVEDLRALQNDYTKRIAETSHEQERQEMIDKMKELKGTLQKKEKDLGEI
ncbi:MAG: serine--tRNA ligase, partial [Nitrospinae bacterium]|nr:serine--tRNA ligase [Nitrospinota bacterium]